MSPSRHLRGRWATLALFASLPLLAIIGLGVFLSWNAVSVAGEVGYRKLFSSDWAPLQGEYGLGKLIMGTLISALLALLIAAPVGICASIYLAFHAGRRVRKLVDATVALLGGLPSVIIGLWGLTWVVPIFGNTLASAMIVLALMIVPTLCLLAGAALRQVPGDLIEATRALGVGEGAVTKVALRHARWGVYGAIVLSTSRALGEAVAVSMVAGNVVSWPALAEPVATLPATLIVEFEGAAGTHRDALYLLAFVVMFIIAVMSLFGRFAQRRVDP